MSLAARKLALIEAVIKIDDDELLDEIAMIFIRQREANILTDISKYNETTSQLGNSNQGTRNQRD